MAYFKAKNAPQSISAGAPRWGSLQRSPRPPSWIWGPTSKGRGGEGRGGKGNMSTPQHKFLVAPLADHYIPNSEVAGRQHLRSARRQQLNVPRVRSVIGRRAFASAGPTIWNSLRDNLRDLTVELDQFQQELKTHLFACLLNTSSTVR